MSSVNGLGFAKMRAEIRKEKDKYNEYEIYDRFAIGKSKCKEKENSGV